MNPLKVTILNVDDDEAKRYTVSRILKKEGFIVHEATSGEDALRKVALRRRSHRPRREHAGPRWL